MAVDSDSSWLHRLEIKSLNLNKDGRQRGPDKVPTRFLSVQEVNEEISTCALCHSRLNCKDQAVAKLKGYHGHCVLRAETN